MFPFNLKLGQKFMSQTSVSSCIFNRANSCLRYVISFHFTEQMVLKNWDELLLNVYMVQFELKVFTKIPWLCGKFSALSGEFCKRGIPQGVKDVWPSSIEELGTHKQSRTLNTPKTSDYTQIVSVTSVTDDQGLRISVSNTSHVNHIGDKVSSWSQVLTALRSND